MRTWLLLFAITRLTAAEDAPARLLAQAQNDLAAGRYTAAIHTGGQAAAQFHQSGDRPGERRALTAVGLAQLYSGDYALSLDSFREALRLARQTSDVSNEIILLNNIGNAYYFQGHYSDAMDRYQEALRRTEASAGEPWARSRRQLSIANSAILHQTLGQYEQALKLYNDLLHSPVALPPSEQAQLLANVGTLRRRLGDPQKALSTYLEAQTLYRNAINRDGEIAVLNNIGIVRAMDLGDLRAAAETFSDALKLAAESGNRPMVVHARLYRGETFFRAGKLQDSVVDFQAAADGATQLGELEESWKALYGLARIAARKGDNAKCDALLRRAISAIESLRANVRHSSLRSDFLADKRDVYDLLIEHTTGVEELFQLMERSRARNLQDRLHSGAVPQLRDVARALPANTAALEYWVGPSSAAVLWISAAGSGVRRWSITQDNIRAIAELPSLLADQAATNWRDPASVVSKELLSDIPPLQRPDIRHLVIIPDDAMSRLPFEALPLDATNLVIERFNISYLPSASVWQAPITRRAVHWPWQTAIEAFANPTPGGASLGERAWAPLAEAAREVNGIARILHGRSSVYIGPEARKAVLTDAVNAPVLHFATHAFADMNDPARSYILLAPPSQSQGFDRLFLKEVEDLPLKGVDLVTVSACETNAGKAIRGEGVQSFSRAFLAAGARSVVTSLWAVGDRATADLMLQFYSRLAQGQFKADALRAAKLEVLHRPESAHPAHWAAFVINGESLAPLPYMVSWTSIVSPLALLAGTILFFRMRGRRE